VTMLKGKAIIILAIGLIVFVKGLARVASSVLREPTALWAGLVLSACALTWIAMRLCQRIAHWHKTAALGIALLVFACICIFL